MNGEHELPEGWIETTIGALLEINYGKGLKRENRTEGGFPVYGSNGVVGYHKTAITKGPTIIIGRKGSVGEINFSNVPCWPIDTTYYIDEFQGLDIKFFYSLFKHQNFVTLDKSTTIPGINRDDIYSQTIPLPPLAEQHRIVAAVKALLARVNASRERLDRVPGLLKAFRQAVLAAAASKWIDAFQKVHLEDVIIKGPQNGLYKSSDYYGKGVPIIRIDSIYDGKLCRNGGLKRLECSNAEVERYGVEEGNILINRVNSLEFLGKCAFIEEIEEPTVFESNMMRITLDHRKIDGRFLTFILCSPIIREQIFRKAKHAVNQASINQTDVRSLSFYLPPLPEQHEIVRRVESLFALADRIEQRVAAGKERADRLTQAILAKAFRGELVPTEAELARMEEREYEPASMLLERIRRERESQGEGKPRTRKIRSEKGGE